MSLSAICASILYSFLGHAAGINANHPPFWGSNLVFIVNFSYLTALVSQLKWKQSRAHFVMIV